MAIVPSYLCSFANESIPLPSGAAAVTDSGSPVTDWGPPVTR
jgi:hypothetical protein